MENRESEFLERIGALTILILVLIFTFYFGWLILSLLGWICFSFMVIHGISEFLKTKKFYNVLFSAPPFLISSVSFWMLFSFVDIIFKNLYEVIFWHTVFLIILSILFYKFTDKNTVNEVN